METRCAELSKMSPTCTDGTSKRLLGTAFATFATFAIAEAAFAFAAFATEGGSIAIVPAAVASLRRSEES